MQGVSKRFLMQTLDKKLMKDLRVRSTNQQKTLFSSEWATSTSMVPSSDAQIQEEESISLISSGACGAFIHGLEDEFLEVRYECVNALWKLAVDCPEFAAKSIDFLVDMFNDEIESVRLSAIQSLSRITHYVLLTDDQIEIVLPVLEVGFFIHQNLFLLNELPKISL
jgi:integrator complex subunit 4